MGANTIETVHADNYFRSEGILKDLAKEFDFKWDFSPVLRPQANGQVERIHTDLRTLIPWIMKKLNIREHQWSDSIHHAAMILNSIPHSRHGFPPELIQFGSVTNGLLLDQKTPLSTEMKQLWKLVRNRLETAREANLKGISGPFKQMMLQPGDKIFAILSKNIAVKARVLHDFGHSVWIEKENGPNRFSKVVVHKSLITRRLDFNRLPEEQ